MSAVNIPDIERMKQQRHRKALRKAALLPLTIKRYRATLMYGYCVIDPGDDDAAIEGLPKPSPLPWGPK